ncbi:hypothetical protein Moror_15345 [Moniliophthora roreri MCA 2997]|uniref:Uncharacterized protein n=1 Tax=Moniliophthora roreri (strain MCA 2997) TaxID=1381753 RepID=V2X5R9_MONRO|nr:hypothetical protein Moror_15345 [Moniliophthora roreri MCA 2997]
MDQDGSTENGEEDTEETGNELDGLDDEQEIYYTDMEEEDEIEIEIEIIDGEESSEEWEKDIESECEDEEMEE